MTPYLAGLRWGADVLAHLLDCRDRGVTPFADADTGRSQAERADEPDRPVGLREFLHLPDVPERSMATPEGGRARFVGGRTAARTGARAGGGASAGGGMSERRRVYLAARYDRRLEMLGRADELERLGYVVTSRWVQGLHEGATEPDVLGRCAREDLADIIDSDIFITFTESAAIGHTSGGRHVEMGYALACDLWVIVVGPPENVFHHMDRGTVEDPPLVTRVDTWGDVIAVLP